jgi:hypothetical protein
MIQQFLFDQEVFEEAYIRAQKQVEIAEITNRKDRRSKEQKIEDAHCGNISEIMFNRFCLENLKTPFTWTGRNIEDDEMLFATSDFILHQFNGNLKINIKSSLFNDNPVYGPIVTTERFNLPCSLAVKLESDLYIYSLVDMENRKIYWMSMISGKKLRMIRDSQQHDTPCQYDGVQQPYPFGRPGTYILIDPKHADCNDQLREFLTNTRVS